jgi:hypothetical protein
MKNKHVRLNKTFALKAGAVSENTITMAASTTGNPDRIGDVIFPGAFKAPKKGFVDNGSLLVGHDWDDMPIGMIMDAKEVGPVFEVQAQFHDTESGQEARQICVERLAAGKSVSVSIGFMPDYEKGVMWFESGAKLLDFAETNGYDLELFDTKAIKKLGWCRGVMAIDEVFEVSLVTVGMNPKAKATDAKTFSGDLDALSALRFADHLETALSVGEGIAIRVADYKASRDREDRTMSPERIPQIKRLHELFGQILAGLEEAEPEETPVDEPTPEPTAEENEAKSKKFQELAAKTLAHRTLAHTTGEIL